MVIMGGLLDPVWFLDGRFLLQVRVAQAVENFLLTRTNHGYIIMDNCELLPRGEVIVSYLRRM